MARRSWLKHLFTAPFTVRSYFSPDALSHIERAIAQSEKRHSAEIRFVVEGGLDLPELASGVVPRARAIRLFSELGMWDTEENNGVLLYLLLADRTIEIIADRGADKKIGRTRWSEICSAIEAHFRGKRYEQGVIEAIELITAELEKHFPPRPGDKNELPDAPVRI